METVQEALDSLGLALTEYYHKWTPELRRKYEEASEVVANFIEVGIYGIKN